MSETCIIPKQIPKKILNEKRFDDLILYTLGSFGPCEREIFINDTENGINDRMNKNTFHKWAKELKSANFIEVNKENKNSVYTITQLGLDELLRRLKLYQLDFDTLNRIEQKRIQNYIKSIKQFFKKYEIIITDIKTEFIELTNEITHDKLDFFSEEKFNKLILYIALNHPRFYPIYTISSKNFREKYNKPSDTIKENLTDADIQQFLQKIMIEKIYGEKFYCLNLDIDRKSTLYFRINSTYGDIFKTVMNTHFKRLYNLNSLGMLELNNDWLEDAYIEILNQLVDNFNIFNKDLRNPLRKLLDEYKAKLQEEIKMHPIMDTSFMPYYSIMDSVQFQDKPKYDSKEKKELRVELQEINKEIENNPDVPDFLLKKAEVLYKLHNSNDALKIVNKAIILKPVHISEYLKTKAIILSDKKLKDLIGSVLMIKGPEKIKIFVQFIENLNKRSLKLINKAIRTNNDEKFLSILFGVKASFLRYMRKSEEALNCINNAIDLDKKNPLENKDDILGYDNYYKLKIRILFSLKHEKEASNLIEKELKNGNITLRDKANLFWENDRYEEAIELYNNLIESDKDDLTLLEDKAMILSELGKFKKADEIYEFLIEKNSDEKEYFPARYLNYMNMENFDKALEVIDQVYKKSPKLKRNKLEDIYLILKKKKKYKDALYTLNRLLKLKNDKDSVIEFNFNKSKIHSKLKEYNKALLILNDLIKKNTPKSSENLYIYSYKPYLLAKLGYKEDCTKEIEKLLKEFPDKKEMLLYTYGRILMQFEDFKLAISKFMEIIEIDQESYKSYVKIAKCYKTLGQYELSLKNLNNARKKVVEKRKEKMEIPPRYYNIIIKNIDNLIGELKNEKLAISENENS